MSKRSGRLVYSTDSGRSCPQCRQVVSRCRCRTQSSAAKPDSGDGVVRLHHERKGRKGKGVTLIRGLALGDDDLAALAKQLKSACGVGGTVKDRVIEVQSADREKLRALLVAQGYQVKIAGG